MEHKLKLKGKQFQDLKNLKEKRIYRINGKEEKEIRVGDTIRFLKLPNLKEEILMDVSKIETFNNGKDCYHQYYEEDLKDYYKNIEEFTKDCGDLKNSPNLEYIVLTVKKHRIAHYNATICYLRKKEKVLMIKFSKKWNKVYAPPGGKMESGESPLECIFREYREETGLTLIKPKLQGISYWKDVTEGIIFVYVAEDFTGNLLKKSEEGSLEWVDLKEFNTLEQFDQNKKFAPYLFKPEIFEAKFLLDNNCNVLEYEINSI